MPATLKSPKWPTMYEVWAMTFAGVWERRGAAAKQPNAAKIAQGWAAKGSRVCLLRVTRTVKEKY